MIIYAYFWLIFDRPAQGSIFDLPLSLHEQIWHLNRVISILSIVPILWHLSSGCMDQYHIEYMHPEQHLHLFAIYQYSTYTLFFI